MAPSRVSAFDEISELSCDTCLKSQSKNEDSNANLSTKRTQVEASNSNQKNTKRQKKNPADDLICPLTQELPWAPVIAGDGRTYEEEAIKKHFEIERQNGVDIKSPLTHKAMTDTLIPAPHVRNLIETLIENEAIEGNVVETWNQKVQQTKAKQELLQKANSGDGKAMYSVAVKYRLGSKGFKMDQGLAYKWYKKAHDAKEVKGTAALGYALVTGYGVASNMTLGMMYLTQAATRGSNYAASLVGRGLANGSWGFPKGEREAAIYWLRKSLEKTSCPHRHMNKESEFEARVLLHQLERAKAGCESDDLSMICPIAMRRSRFVRRNLSH